MNRLNNAMQVVETTIKNTWPEVLKIEYMSIAAWHYWRAKVQDATLPVPFVFIGEGKVVSYQRSLSQDVLHLPLRILYSRERQLTSGEKLAGYRTVSDIMREKTESLRRALITNNLLNIPQFPECDYSIQSPANALLASIREEFYSSEVLATIEV